MWNASVTADRAAEEDFEQSNGAGPSTGLTFDDTSEFVRAISYTPAVVKAEPTEPIIVRIDTSSMGRDTDMAEGDEALTELKAESGVKDEEMEDDETALMLMAIEEAMQSSTGKVDDSEEAQVDDVSCFLPPSCS